MAVIGSTLGSALAGGAVVGAGVSSAVANRDAARAATEQAFLNAEQVEASNVLDARQAQIESRARVGALRARAGASGITPGSFALNLADEIFQGELNRAVILSRGSQQAQGFRNQARLIRTQGRSQFTSEAVSSVARGVTLGAQTGSII